MLLAAQRQDPPWQEWNTPRPAPAYGHKRHTALGRKAIFLCERQSAAWDRGLSAPSFARRGLVAFRGSVLPMAPVWGGGRVALSLFSLSRGKEGESRKKPPCSYLVCLLEKLEIRVAGLGVKCCLSPLERTALERDEVCGPNVCFFVRAANWRYCSSGKLCELRLSLVFPSGSPSSRALSRQCGGGGMRTLGREAPAAAAPAVLGWGECPGTVGRAEGVTQLLGSVKDCKVGVSSLARGSIRFCLPCQVGLSGQSCHSKCKGLGRAGGAGEVML